MKKNFSQSKMQTYCVTCSDTIHNSIQHIFKISIMYTTIFCIKQLHNTVLIYTVTISLAQEVLRWLFAGWLTWEHLEEALLWVYCSYCLHKYANCYSPGDCCCFLQFFFSSQEKTSCTEFSATICSIKCFTKHPLTRGYYHLFLAPLKFGCCHGHRID